MISTTFTIAHMCCLFVSTQRSIQKRCISAGTVPQCYLEELSLLHCSFHHLLIYHVINCVTFWLLNHACYLSGTIVSVTTTWGNMCLEYETGRAQRETFGMFCPAMLIEGIQHDSSRNTQPGDWDRSARRTQGFNMYLWFLTSLWVRKRPHQPIHTPSHVDSSKGKAWAHCHLILTSLIDEN